ncbi:hypothetical protein A3C91_03925 [Candidatus Azambacteria bacterium RIFCSPHIGHO2_02_FULL_52_12]|uniref:50S ribosomal protein L29 n=1 Tax=Candidatus Azambacteria bacterium RIFCSPLOWO2_01_FULL_46_25 TaxID=1797298 RepID=A0A1F5BUV8_9BACT|nr:MAG: hypothetical protein A3C91_03925 [Candidatus Azambacteria bacterium RIFCSPHIGHO2_02_FULL_52_12]OGD34415.1 MAG: hypothetical protein A2988_02710 [Candidatus Azambacteria bacterium RIFCSPLOWO2_01_FULL_46_25]OGD37307.1 MAG: hypothetical protein A2850_01180 [Candidatus Azambacteria bacterium RIFCSPHIGHO2_01_FULL_51_74]
MKARTGLLEKVNELEKGLQALKLEILLRPSAKQKRQGATYKDQAILKEVRRVRKTLWHDRYSKAV